MGIVEILLEETGKLLLLDIEDRKSLLLVLENCKKSGTFGVTSLRTFVERGFPFVQILSNIKKISIKEAAICYERKEVTYEDLLCMISIFAQDIKFRSQHG